MLAVVAGGCAQETTFEPPLESLTSRTVVTAYVTIPSATTLPLDPALIEICVQRVQFGAFLGTDEYADLWAVVGQDVVALQDACEALARTDPPRVLRMAREWADIQAFMTAGEASTPTTS